MLEAWQLLVSFGRIGLFALGGGNSMITLIEQECVENRGWLSIEEFATLLGASYLFPGLTAVKLSALIGLKVAGVPGMIAGVLALNLPGLVLAVVLWRVIVTHQDSALVRKLLVGMRYGAVALLGAALYALAKPLATDQLSLPALILALALFVAVALFDISPFVGIVIFVLAAVIVI